MPAFSNTPRPHQPAAANQTIELTYKTDRHGNGGTVRPGRQERRRQHERSPLPQLQGVTDDSLGIDSGKGRETFTRQEVKRVAVKKQGHRGRNTLIGLGTGAAIGAVAGAAYYTPCTGLCILNPTRAQDAGVGAVVLGVVGAVVGALIPTGGWHEVYKQ